MEGTATLLDRDPEQRSADSDQPPKTGTPATLQRVGAAASPLGTEDELLIGDAQYRMDFAAGQCFLIVWTYYPWESNVNVSR